MSTFRERKTLLIFILNRFQITQNPSSAYTSHLDSLNLTKILFTNSMFFPTKSIFCLTISLFFIE